MTRETQVQVEEKVRSKGGVQVQLNAVQIRCSKLMHISKCDQHQPEALSLALARGMFRESLLFDAFIWCNSIQLQTQNTQLLPQDNSLDVIKDQSQHKLKVDLSK